MGLFHVKTQTLFTSLVCLGQISLDKGTGAGPPELTDSALQLFGDPVWQMNTLYLCLIPVSHLRICDLQGEKALPQEIQLLWGAPGWLSW